MRDLANELVNLGHKVWLVSRDGRQANLVDHKVVQIRDNFYEWRLMPLILKLILLIKREKIDVIHAHQRFPILLTTIIGLLLKLPTVATVHGMSRHDLMNSFVKRNISSIIFINERIYTSYKFSPVIGNKIHYIPNGIVIGEEQKNTEDKDNINCRSDNTIRIYYVSRIDRRHGGVVARLIDEVMPMIKKEYPSVEFHIVGEGKGLEGIEKQDSVFLHYYSEELYQFYRDANLIIGVGRVAAESLANGIPLLSIKNNHLGEIVTRENFERLSYSNFVAVNSSAFSSKKAVDTIMDFCRREPFYKKEALFLKKVVCEARNIRSITEKTVDIYTGLL